MSIVKSAFNDAQIDFNDTQFV